jgi:DNA-binding response OmpR family regulator
MHRPPVATCVVLDDVESVRNFVARVLAREHLDVIAARNGIEATAALAAQRCDLLIADLTMPGGEGIDTIRAARTKYPELKILVISGISSADAKQTADSVGADASLHKPFSIVELVAAVRALLGPLRHRS